MGIKNIYEINNISVGDTTKADSYVLVPPEGEVDFPVRDLKIPTSMKGFKTIVINNPTIEVGTADLNEIS